MKQEHIEALRNNREQITSELLASIRAKSRQDAIDVLDNPKNDKNQYIDSFGQPLISSMTSMRKPEAKVDLPPILVEELKKCANDVNYFKDNYVKIATPTKGIDFPEFRPYNKRYLDALCGEHEEVVGLMGRQCIDGKTQLTTNKGIKTIKELFDEN